MRLIGLKFHSVKKLNGDFAGFPTTHAIGGGDWLIEVPFMGGVKEFCGPNGSRRDEEPADLWAEYDEWCNQPLPKPVKYWIAPDNTVGTYSFFLREAQKGRLHGLMISIY